METTTIAHRLVSLCKEGKYDQVYAELFDPEKVQSIEPSGGQFETVVGLDAIQQKGEEWNAMVEEVISSEISDPIVAENYFSLSMKVKVKLKGQSDVSQMDEICVYQVANGKIISEQFFYTPEAHAV